MSRTRVTSTDIDSPFYAARALEPAGRRIRNVQGVAPVAIAVVGGGVFLLPRINFVPPRSLNRLVDFTISLFVYSNFISTLIKRETANTHFNGKVSCFLRFHLVPPSFSSFYPAMSEIYHSAIIPSNLIYIEIERKRMDRHKTNEPLLVIHSIPFCNSLYNIIKRKR